MGNIACQQASTVSSSPMRKPGKPTSANIRQRAGDLNQLVDRCLLEATAQRTAAVLLATAALETDSVAERVRRRATLLERNDRSQRPAIQKNRDSLILALYAAAAPAGWYTAWSDASVLGGHEPNPAGIGGLVLAPQGDTIARICQSTGPCAPFLAELEAVAAVTRAAIQHGAKRLRVHTDCAALVALWLQKRDDPRLDELRDLIAPCSRFELRRVPRQHNRPAHRLARQAISA